MLSLLLLVPNFINYFKLKISETTYRRILVTLRNYKRFVYYSLPNSVLTILSKEGIIILLAMVGDLSLVSFFAFSRSIIYAPAVFLSSLLGPIFLRDFTENQLANTFNHRAKKTFIVIFVLALPIYVGIGLNSAYIFEIIFGKLWVQGAEIFMFLLPAGFLLLFNSWIDRIFEVQQKTHLALALQIISDLTILVVLFMAMYVSVNPTYIFKLYALIFCFHQLAYLILASSLIFNLRQVDKLAEEMLNANHSYVTRLYSSFCVFLFLHLS